MSGDDVLGYGCRGWEFMIKDALKFENQTGYGETSWWTKVRCSGRMFVTRWESMTSQCMGQEWRHVQNKGACPRSTETEVNTQTLFQSAHRSITSKHTDSLSKCTQSITGFRLIVIFGNSKGLQTRDKCTRTQDSHANTHEETPCVCTQQTEQLRQIDRNRLDVTKSKKLPATGRHTRTRDALARARTYPPCKCTQTHHTLILIESQSQTASVL